MRTFFALITILTVLFVSETIRAQGYRTEGKPVVLAVCQEVCDGQVSLDSMKRLLSTVSASQVYAPDTTFHYYYDQPTVTYSADSRNGATAVEIAVDSGDFVLFRLLDSVGGGQERDQLTAPALGHGNVAVADFLAAHGTRPTPDDLSDYLADRRYDTPEEHPSPGNQDSMLAFFFSNGIDPNMEASDVLSDFSCSSFLNIAAGVRDTTAVRFLLAHGAKADGCPKCAVSGGYRTPLIEAVVAVNTYGEQRGFIPPGELGVVKLLVEAGANVNQTDGGYSVLYYAKGQASGYEGDAPDVIYEVIQYLKSKGALDLHQ